MVETKTKNNTKESYITYFICRAFDLDTSWWVYPLISIIVFIILWNLVYKRWINNFVDGMEDKIKDKCLNAAKRGIRIYHNRLIEYVKEHNTRVEDISESECDDLQYITIYGQAAFDEKEKLMKEPTEEVPAEKTEGGWY